MKKKGFTLMELLAVIVILAILALITLPIVTNLIKNSKKEAFRLSVGQVSDNIYFHYTKDWLLEGMSEDKVFDFDTNTNIDLLNVSGKLPSSGTITINPQGKISIDVNDGVYCAVKTIDQDKISVGSIVNGVCELTGEEVDTCDIDVGYYWVFDYVSSSDDKTQNLSVPCSGYYKLEVWGAQGGSYNNSNNSSTIGGFGGYSTGSINLKKGENLFIFVGQQGVEGFDTTNAGYTKTVYSAYPNGGGVYRTSGSLNIEYSGGGGSTHIAKVNKLIEELSPDSDDLLIVAGGGGGSTNYWSNYGNGGSGGGYIGASTINNFDGVNATGGTQGSSGLGGGNNGSYPRENAFMAGKYGKGGGCGTYPDGEMPSVSGGGGGGYYGGGASWGGSGAGGSGYIGNTNLKSKYMYCYNCTTSTEAAYYTISGKMYSNRAISSTAKQGNGYAKITYLGKQEEETVIACSIGKTWEYDYKEVSGSGVEQTFTPSCTGYYKLEVWGAQGGTVSSGYIGGRGAYATGVVRMEANEPLYINVGGQGKVVSGYNVTIAGGYNGGGQAYGGGDYYRYAGSGGGATHIALDSGLIPTFSNKQDRLLIVAAGGSGTWYTGSSSGWETREAGHAGGIKGTTAVSVKNSTYYYGDGGTQTTGNAFGQGYNSTWTSGGGGGGYYTGYPAAYGVGGSSSYIGNNLLYKKAMYCYKCEISNEISTSTKIAFDASDSPLRQYAKQGNGYAIITYLGETIDTSYNATEGEYWNYNYKSVNGSGVEQTFIVPVTGKYKLEVWGAQGGSVDSTYIGGYGGYSTGEIELTRNTTLYINVGGAGIASSELSVPGGYNGGGNATGGNCNNDIRTSGSGGGATHIALASGLLTAFDPTLENSINNKLLIAAGGGGGSFYLAAAYGSGAAGGGIEGVKGSWTNRSNYGHNYYVQSTGGTQTTPGTRGYSYSVMSGSASFGQGESFNGAACGNGAGGGGGYYGGGAGQFASGAGGSGYIGYDLLNNKHMSCYNCTTSASTNINTYTISNTCNNSTAIANCAKQGNGHARITLLEIK